jgi:hypothetical protein
MTKVILVGGDPEPSNEIVIPLPNEVSATKAALLELKGELSAQWPVVDVQLRHRPLRMKNPYVPGVLYNTFVIAGREIVIHFSSAVQDTAAMLMIADVVKRWCASGKAKNPKKAKRKRKAGKRKSR